MTISAYPLTWPAQFPRTADPEAGRFKATLAASLKNVQTSLNLFGRDSGQEIGELVISSNVTLGQNRPADAGVAAWFTWEGLQVCIPVDRYRTVEANLQAIHHIIEARRVELRHGTLALVRATFTGFLALEAPSKDNWWDVLGVSRSCSTSEARAAYRRLRSAHHPDKEGSAEAFDRIQKAFSAACAEHGVQE